MAMFFVNPVFCCQMKNARVKQKAHQSDLPLNQGKYALYMKYI